MSKLLKALVLVVALASGACAAQAQTAPREATIDDAAWLAGRWVGEGFGGQMEEAWAPPVAGQMVGHFRHWSGGQIRLYELLLIDVAEGGLRMRVKHFNADFTAWEDRGDWHTFEPVSVSANEIAFDGLVITREGPDAMRMRIRIRRGEAVSEDILTFRRAPL